MAKASAQLAARERARKAKATADAERVERDGRIEDHQVRYFTADAQVTELEEQLTVLRRTMVAAVEKISEEGEPLDRIASLLDSTPADIRALRKLTAPASTAAATTATPDAPSRLESAGPPSEPAMTTSGS